MKKLIILTFLFVYAATAHSQTVNFNWIQQLERKTGLPFDESYFIATDTQKNVYVAGNFHFTVDLDPGPGVSNVTSNYDNIFVCKFNSAGIFMWGKHLGQNTSYTVCKSIAVDANGNIYTTGYFTGTADFDPGQGFYNLTSNATVDARSPDVFISKLDAGGNFKWAKQIGDNNVDIGNSIDADTFGNVFITGYFSGVVDLDPGAGVLNKGSQGNVNAFVTKLDTAGNFKFSKVFEGNHTVIGQFIRTDSRGNIYTSGHFDGNVDLDPGSGVQSFTTDISAEKNFLSKLDSLGNYVWAIKDITGVDIATDLYGSVYTYNGELVKYDANGNKLWSKVMGGSPNSTYPLDDIKTDNSGNIYLTGLFRSTQDFDPGPATYNLSVTGGGYASDVFICKLNNNGNFMWAKAFGGPLEDYATSLAIGKFDEVYTTGVFLGQSDFDPNQGTYNITSPAGGGVFVHKMSPCKNIPPNTLNISSCKVFTLNNITYNRSGTYQQVITTNSGCDSIIILHLQITSVETNLQVVTCNNYFFNGKQLTYTGKYNDTIQSINGCDSIIHLDLTITKSDTVVNVTICNGDSYAGHSLAGTYTDTYHNLSGCDSNVTVHLAVQSKPVLTLLMGKELCPGDSIILSPGNFNSYLWQDGSTLPAYMVKKAGIYGVTVSNTCGIVHGEIKVTEANCSMFFPTAFTPNHDGKNDRFALLHPHAFTDFLLTVYNRYGQVVFKTKDYSEGWTGIFKSEPAPTDTYVWYCQFKEAGKITYLKGTVLLVR